MTTTDWVLGTRSAVCTSIRNVAEKGMSCAFVRAGWFHTKLRIGKSNFSLVQLVCIGVAMESSCHVTIHLLASSARRGVHRKWLDPSWRTLHKCLVPYRRLPQITRASRSSTHRILFILSCLFDRNIIYFLKDRFNRRDISLTSLRKRIKFGPLFVRPEAIVPILLHDRSSGFFIVT